MAEQEQPMEEQRRALLIFVRPPKHGKVKTRLAASVGSTAALELYKQCCACVVPPLVHQLRAQGVQTFVFWASSRQAASGAATTTETSWIPAPAGQDKTASVHDTTVMFEPGAEDAKTRSKMRRTKEGGAVYSESSTRGEDAGIIKAMVEVGTAKRKDGEGSGVRGKENSMIRSQGEDAGVAEGNSTVRGEERGEAETEEEKIMEEWMAELGLCGFVRLIPQVSSPDLGQRVRAAFEAAASHGFSRLALVGSDIPDISHTIVWRAFEALSSFPAAFGPACDGGYYLVAVRPPVPPPLFVGIPWSTPSVLVQSLAAAEAAGIKVAPQDALPTLPDIDTVQDLSTWLQHHLSAVESKEKEAGEEGRRLAPFRLLVERVLADRKQLLDDLSMTGYVV